MRMPPVDETPRKREPYKLRADPNRQRRLPVTLTEEETEALLAQVKPGSALGLRNRAILAAILGAGLGVSEVVALRPRDINFREGTVSVKSGKPRVIPVDGHTLAWLSAWAERRKGLGLTLQQPFFCRLRTKGVGKQALPAGGVMTTRNLQVLLRRLAEQAGLGKRVTPRTLRHTYASRLLARGFTLQEVQELLGHSDIASTLVYAQDNPQALKAKVQSHASRAELAAHIAALEEELAALRKAAGL
jgi:integrase/recombinase XerD